MSSILLISTIAAIGPVLGSLFGVFIKCSPKTLYNFLGFSAGIMLSISLFQLLPQSIDLSPLPISIFGLVAGLVFIFIIDLFIPHIHASHKLPQTSNEKLKKTATLIIIGIFIHNFPEGFAIGVGALQGLQLSLLIALGISIHDIPEAVCTSLPYYTVTKKRLKSFLISVSTVIPTLLGIFTAYFLGPYFSNLIGFFMAATAGVMMFIAITELIPVSFENLKYKSLASITGGLLLIFILNLL